MFISFRLKFFPFVATVVVVSIGISLAQWQTRRALEKEQIANQINIRSHLPPTHVGSEKALSSVSSFSKVSMRGEYVAQWPLYLDNRPMQGNAGFVVLMPFHLEGTQRYVLVARGWQPRNQQDRKALLPLSTPVGSIEIGGVVRDQLDRVMQLGQADALKPAAIVQNVDISQLAKQSGFDFEPSIVEQTSDIPDGLLRQWPMPSAGAEKHRAYAFQWYALSAMACLFFVVTGIRRGKHKVSNINSINDSTNNASDHAATH
ncbi:SURF1 family protein [Undibacterium sp. RuRC25W]|uniref:SURF1 family protein n=1 Tax=Undibacterium sp. RuRC25W TaxID=3413047 RepID=UPI003BF02F9F